MSDIVDLCRERSKGYGALRGACLTAFALDKAADEIEALRTRNTALQEEVERLRRQVIMGGTGDQEIADWLRERSFHFDTGEHSEYGDGMGAACRKWLELVDELERGDWRKGNCDE